MVSNESRHAPGGISIRRNSFETIAKYHNATQTQYPPTPNIPESYPAYTQLQVEERGGYAKACVGRASGPGNGYLIGAVAAQGRLSGAVGSQRVCGGAARPPRAGRF